MKILFSLLFACGGLFAQTLTPGERSRALSELQGSSKLFLDAAADLSDAQWNFKPDAKSWSIAECAEHIALSEDEMFATLNKTVKSPADPAKKAEAKGKDEEILKMLADRGHKAQAPESLVPRHKWNSRQALLDHFRQSRGRTLDYVRSTQDDLRNHFTSLPRGGAMDAYQWILLISGHTARHVAQIEEVKTNANFPRN